MKTMIYSLALTALLLPLGSCSDDDSPVLTQKDWDGTATYFASTDEMTFATYYKPYVGYVGDPMPFYDPVAQEFKILYLQDFRPNPETYHPIWGVSTKDAASYTSMGEVIPTGTAAEPDAAIGTGSTIYNEPEKMYYTFYTGHTASQEVVMVATSSDFKQWTKDRSFYLQGADYGYSVRDFRDPFVFKGDDGQFHMLVSTMQGTKGVLVEFVSPNLKSWEHKGVFMTMMWDRFYECPDVFKMGDWWYLVYSEKHTEIRKVQYFKGRTLDELKATTVDDKPTWPDDHEGFLDSRGFYAGKTASDGTNRYIWGWCPTRAGNDNTEVGAAPNEPEWAGNLVAHKIIQHEDGTLTLGAVEGIDKKYASEQEVKIMAQSESGVTGDNGVYTMTGDSYILFNRLQVHNKISFTVKTSSAADKFGFSFVRGTDSKKYYSIIVNPESDVKRKINFEEEGEEGKGFIKGIDGYIFDTPADNTYHVTVYTDNSICVVYINDNVAYTNRIYGMQKNCWSINNYGGSIEVSDVKVNVQK
ncbi:glycoside hydrolase domain-containing protein [Phocaeicola plebeius]|jgi:beta-fructofuranosidase|uniref:glycoside hydrolase domain-containing protein n=1 Tax=Phocaeicola plebeius TaxID=310297 RepID=UPI003AF0BA69